MAEKWPWNCQGWQFEITVLKTGHETAKVGSLRTCLSSWIGQMAEKWPWNCQGRQFEDQKPQTAKVGSFDNVAVKLRRSAVWVHKEKCGSNCQGWQFYGHFFKLPNMGGLPKCTAITWCDICDRASIFTSARPSTKAIHSIRSICPSVGTFIGTVVSHLLETLKIWNIR